MSKKLPSSAGPAVVWALDQWKRAIELPGRRPKTKALRKLVITQAMEIDKLRIAAEELEEAYEKAQERWAVNTEIQDEISQRQKPF